MRRIIKMVIFLIAAISLIFSVAAAEDIVYSERCIGHEERCANQILTVHLWRVSNRCSR